MIEKQPEKNRILRKAMYAIHRLRAEKYMVEKIRPFLRKEDRIIDIGSGPCNVCEILEERGFDVTPLDVKNLSVVDGIEPIIYDGENIPFEDDSFDASLILTVLHHCPVPEKIIREAKRVSKRIIIIEDVYSNFLHKYITYFSDSLGNFEFRGHPHSNKTDKGWKSAFRELGLELVEKRKNYCFPSFKHATYVLEK